MTSDEITTRHALITEREGYCVAMIEVFQNLRRACELEHRILDLEQRLAWIKTDRGKAP